MWSNDKLVHMCNVGQFALLHIKCFTPYDEFKISAAFLWFMLFGRKNHYFANYALLCGAKISCPWGNNDKFHVWSFMTIPNQDEWCRFTFYLGFSNLELLFLALKSKNQHVCSSTKVDISIWEKMIGDGRSSWLWIRNAWDDVPIEISDKTHILLPYMHQLLSARNALFFRNCKVFGNS